MATKPNVFSQIMAVFTPVHRDGHKFVAIGVAVTVLLFMIWSGLGLLGALATACVAFFFRDPERVSPAQDGLVIAPADGLVSRVEKTSPPAELGLGSEPMTCVAIFLSLLDVHVCRTPVSGHVLASVHKEGMFHNAETPEAHSENERHSLLVETVNGIKTGVVLIAGYAARRIVTYVKVDDALIAGERIGIIRFGSCVEIYLPITQAVLVAEGQRTIGGETVMADLSHPDQIRQFRRN